MKYDFTAIEKKWQSRWKEEKTFACQNGDTSKPKFYGLVEFPYPSAAGLHVGHPRPYTAMDVIARKKRMDGYNVLFPIGYDAFGLPTENFAIKNHVHPAKVTKDNIANFTRQLHMLGYSFDWDRVVDTTDPGYYKWTQWIFLQLYKHGLAYKTTMPVNWCTSCKCVLANEEVVEGVCERCGAPVIRKEKSQWMLKITEYAQQLIDGLDDCGLYRPGQDPAAQLDRPLHRRRGDLQGHYRRGHQGLYHPARHPVRRDLHGPLPGARPGAELAGERQAEECR